MECMQCGTRWISLESLILENWDDSSLNSDIPFFNNLGRYFLYEYYSHSCSIDVLQNIVSVLEVQWRKKIWVFLFMYLSACAFYLLSKVTRLTLQESLKITVKYISSFYIWLQSSRVSLTCFINLTCPVNIVCCLLVQSCTSMYGNCCICFLKPWGGTQWLYHSGRRNEEPSSIWFAIFLCFWSKWKKKGIKKGSIIYFQKSKKP